jgi:hypothetical protein
MPPLLFLLANHLDHFPHLAWLFDHALTVQMMPAFKATWNSVSRWN